MPLILSAKVAMSVKRREGLRFIAERILQEQRDYLYQYFDDAIEQ